MTNKQLDELVAPIALYPDVLLAQVLAASTYPLDVVEADRWLKANKDTANQEAAIDRQDWDPSVKAVARFPQVVAMMSEKLTWTRELGQAVLNQEQSVMDAVQRDRDTARQSGTLKSTPEQTVEDVDSSIVIQPANPQIIYVPQYYPQYVYGFDDYNDYYPNYYGYSSYPYYRNNYPYRYGNYWGLWYDSPIYCGGWLNLDFDWGRRCLYYGGWGYRHHRHDFDNRHGRHHRSDWSGHGSFDRFSSDHRWRHGSDGDRHGGRGDFAVDRGGMNRIGLTTDRFNRHVDSARISQRLRSSNFSFGGDLRSGTRVNRSGAAGPINATPRAGIRADSRVNRDNVGQFRTGGSNRAGQIAPRQDLGQTRGSFGGSLRRSDDVGVRRGASLGRGADSGRVPNYSGRSYRMGGLASGSFDRGSPAIRSGGGGGNFRGGSPTIRSGGGGGNFRRRFAHDPQWRRGRR